MEEGLQAAKSNSRLHDSPAHNPGDSSPKRALSFISFLSPDPDLGDCQNFHQGYPQGTNLHHCRKAPSSPETRVVELNLLGKINTSNALLCADAEPAEPNGRPRYIPPGSTFWIRPLNQGERQLINHNLKSNDASCHMLHNPSSLVTSKGSKDFFRSDGKYCFVT